ncbi:hypothetical protein L1987_50982 [Smallanthus sonchifolius]|uniref:Uncharacterized protein n=1 Tax=Smallanthus sonchifolius TaxID=185202 RepID=A0ACB9EPE2_9ASTR|nr:hypothetical protein L1987_50982 [Smallanthus sonchifolius]
MDVRGQDFGLLPFGGGRRICPGISLGLQNVHTILGAMIQCFEWKAGKKGDLATVDMEEGVGATLPRANPLFQESWQFPAIHPWLSEDRSPSSEDQQGVPLALAPVWCRFKQVSPPTLLVFFLASSKEVSKAESCPFKSRATCSWEEELTFSFVKASLKGANTEYFP